jgi:DNA-binding NtrC family response regulator
LLLLALRGDAPLSGGQGFDLTGVDEVVFGRGGAVALMPGSSTSSARVELSDPVVSGSHARLHFAGEETWLEDLGSRNGTRLNGDLVKRALLRAGDWFVIGRSVFVLGEKSQNVRGEPFTVGASGSLSTFDAETARIYETARSLAPSRVPLMLVAETGTGKEVLAREIHQMSLRPGPFIAVNCAALPETLVESELFGYRRGAFSDAKEDRPGLIRSAQGGTLLLDEVAELPPGSQAKLLRVLQEGEVLPLGATRPVPIDVRIIAATQPSLEKAVQSGTFRADLLGRLAGYMLRLPPLRNRMCDLGLLLSQLLVRHSDSEIGHIKLSSEACIALFQRRWPLNIRELDQALSAAIVLGRSKGEIDAIHLGEAPPSAHHGTPSFQESAEPDDLKERFTASLRRHRGNISAVARDMGKARMQIHRWLEKFDLHPQDFRPPGQDVSDSDQ